MNQLLPYAAHLLLLFAQLDDLDTKPAADPAPAANPPAVAAPDQPADPTAAAAPAEKKADSADGSTEHDKAPSTPEKSWIGEMLNSGAMGYMIKGGIFMWPILFLGVLAAGAIIERYRSLKMLRTDTEGLRSQVTNLLHADRVEEALNLCEGQQGPVPAILATGLRKFLVGRRLGYDPGKIEEQVVKAMDDYGVHIVAALEKHLPILATASSVAPMIGFLGTVQGMVVSFQDIVDNLGKVNIVEAAAAGIMVSLLTTVFGLIVGIPSFTAYNYFASVINGFVLEVEETSTELIEAVTLQMTLNQAQAASTSPPGAAAPRPPQPAVQAAQPVAVARPQPAAAPHPAAAPVVKRP